MGRLPRGDQDFFAVASPSYCSTYCRVRGELSEDVSLRRVSRRDRVGPSFHVYISLYDMHTPIFYTHTLDVYVIILRCKACSAFSLYCLYPFTYHTKYIYVPGNTKRRLKATGMFSGCETGRGIVISCGCACSRAYVRLVTESRVA